MMASFWCKTLVLFVVCMAVQEGCGLPLSERVTAPAQAAHAHRVRTKRCSCNSWEDKECIYFCHLDIIWVNTPSKLLPYGLGSPLSPSRRRRRRSADRCECLNGADKTCSDFCHKSSENAETDLGGEAASSNNKKLLASFRSLVKSNMVIANEILASNKNRGALTNPRGKTRR